MIGTIVYLSTVLALAVLGLSMLRSWWIERRQPPTHPVRRATHTDPPPR